MRFKTLKLALASLALSASSAMAITFDFDSFAAHAQFASKTYTEGGASITATATSGNVGPEVAEKTSPSFHRGLGVVDSVDMQGSIDVGQSLELAIQSGFRVDSIVLTARGNPPQAFDILVDNVFQGSGFVTEANTNTNDGRTTIDVSALAAGSIFTIRASNSTTGGVFLNALELSALTTTAVPLPAGMVLLGGALAVGGVATRRKAKRAA